jgi:hypothetical protein
MTTSESIQMNIRYCRVELNKFRAAICSDDIQKENTNNAIEYYLEQLKDLKFSLSRVVRQESK